MLDPNIIRKDPVKVEKNIRRRKEKESLFDLQKFIELDKKWLSLKKEVESLRAEKNKASVKIPELKKEEKKKKIEEMKKLDKKLDALEEDYNSVSKERKKFWARLPNLMHESVPYGVDDSENVELRREGEIPEFSFAPRDHQELCRLNDWLELERAAKLSGARFYYLKGELVELEMAMFRYVLDKILEKGFTLFETPTLVRKKALFGTGFLPGGEDDLYYIEGKDLALIGTSEVALGGIHMDEVIEKECLPKKYAGLSRCFRTEAGSHGRDTKGFFRVHEFNKIEMFIFCDKESSWEHHEELIGIAEEIHKGLKLPYRVVNICTGDLGNVASKKYDIEAYFPGQENFREVVSCSNCTNYQARRLKARYRDKNENFYCHTLNSTAITNTRTLIAILENYQLPDGRVKVPEVLVPYMGGRKVIGKGLK